MGDNTRDLYHIHIELAVGGGMSRREADALRDKCVAAAVDTVRQEIQPSPYLSHRSYTVPNKRMNWNDK